MKGAHKGIIGVQGRRRGAMRSKGRRPQGMPGGGHNAGKRRKSGWLGEGAPWVGPSRKRGSKLGGEKKTIRQKTKKDGGTESCVQKNGKKDGARQG